jgi:predicted dinucleotide-binding enzyme
MASNQRRATNGRGTTVAVIGAGNMGRAIARRLVAGGHTVMLANQDEGKRRKVANELTAIGPGEVQATTTAEAVSRADIVVFATPYSVTTRLAVELSDVLPGKIVVDISNPLNSTYDDLTTDPETSAAEEIARRVPGACVVKAFNTNFAGPLFDGQAGGSPLDVFLASDDSNAKAEIDALLRPCGLRPLDAGRLANSGTLERAQLLAISIQFKHDLQFQSGFQFLPKDLVPPVQESSRRPRRAVVTSGTVEDRLEALHAAVLVLDERVETATAALRQAAAAMLEALDGLPRGRGAANEAHPRRTH